MIAGKRKQAQIVAYLRRDFTTRLPSCTNCINSRGCSKGQKYSINSYRYIESMEVAVN